MIRVIWACQGPELISICLYMSPIVPFACAEGGLTSANLCMYSPATIDVNKLIQRINSLAASGDLDDTNNLRGDPVFIFHGTKDTTVNPGRCKVLSLYDYER
jgi:predicted esterase